MTNAVVIDKNNTVVIQTNQPQVIYTGIMGPPGPSTLSGLTDVNTTTLNPGSILVYNTQTQTWISTTLLNQQTVDSGQY